MEDPESLRALVNQARRGDNGAWEALYLRSYPRLLSYARRRLGDDDTARDAVGETMARAVRGLAKFRDDGAGFDAWLSGIIRHVVLDLQRAAGRRPVSDDPLPERASSDPGPEDHLARDADAAAVRLAFGLLSEADRELLELRVVLGMTSEEAAKVLGKRPGTVRMAQARALTRLRSHLQDREATGRA